MATKKKVKEVTDVEIKAALAKLGIDQVFGTFSSKSGKEGFIICTGFTRQAVSDYAIRMIAAVAAAEDRE